MGGSRTPSIHTYIHMHMHVHTHRSFCTAPSVSSQKRQAPPPCSCSSSSLTSSSKPATITVHGRPRYCCCVLGRVFVSVLERDKGHCMHGRMTQITSQRDTRQTQSISRANVLMCSHGQPASQQSSMCVAFTLSPLTSRKRLRHMCASALVLSGRRSRLLCRATSALVK